MKSVSLKDIKTYCKSLNSARYKTFTENETLYKQMWHDQKLQFWIKLAISLKYYISRSSTRYDDACEKEIITFLKALTDKNFNAVVNYMAATNACKSDRLKMYMELCRHVDTLKRNIGNSEVEQYRYLRTLTIKMRCAGTFANILFLYHKASVGNDFAFTPPESWFIPTQHAEPLEAFIRSKWSTRPDIEDILGCKPEDISWWKAPAKKVDQSKLKVSATERTSTVEVAAPPPQASKTKKVKNEPSSSKATKVKYGSTPLWLPNLNRCLIFGYNVSQLQVEDSSRRILKMKPIIEFSFPPLMHRKYHIMSADELDKDDVSKNFVGACAWHMLILDTLANPFLRFVQKSYKDGQERLWIPYSMLGIPIINEWVKHREHDKAVLLHIRGVVGSPNEQRDSVEELSEFLLEPCVLMQLPWEPVLLRQWLAAALIEVLRFELETVDLRHWPVPKQVEPLAHSIFSLVSTLKERILLGWTVVSFEATHGTGYESRHPAVIFDHVVLPSIATLKFLCSNKSRQIIQSLKKMSWLNSKESLTDKVNVSPSSYTENKSAANFFVSCFVHFIFWETLVSKYDFFPTECWNDDSKFQELVSEISDKASNPVDENQAFTLNPLKIDELKMLKAMDSLFEKNKQNYTKEKNLQKVTQIMKKLFSKCQHFSPDNCKKLLSIIESDDAKVIADKLPILDFTSTISPLQQLILSGVLYQYIEQCLVKLGMSTSILNCILRLGAHVMAREQLTRMIAACSILVDECPKVCDAAEQCPLGINVFKMNPMDLKDISSVLMDVQKDVPSRHEFFSKYPEEWQKPVEINSQIPSIENGMSEAIAALEARVGRIVWNVVQRNFEKIENKYGAYPDSRLVHYLLPCYISFLLGAAEYPDTPRDNKKRENMLVFVSSLIEHYEQTYTDWFVKNKGLSRHIMVGDEDMTIARGSQEADYLVEGFAFALHGFTGIGRYAEEADTMPYLENLLTVLVRYPMRTEVGITSQIEFMISNSWYNITLRHFYVVHQICFTHLPIPSPDSFLYCHELQDLYFASEVMLIIEHICCLQPKWFVLQFTGQDTPEHDIMNKLLKPMRVWRFELYSMLFETEGKFDYPKKMLDSFINGSGRQMLCKLFNAYLNVRKSLPAKKDDMVVGYFPTYKAPELDKTIEMFYKGTLKTLSLFEVKKEAVLTEKVVQDPKSQVVCNNCKRKEKTPGTFIKCPQCQEQRYPFPDFYCSDRCQSAWWNTEHMAEHLEFELGLCDFSNMSIND